VSTCARCRQAPATTFDDQGRTLCAPCAAVVSIAVSDRQRTDEKKSGPSLLSIASYLLGFSGVVMIAISRMHGVPKLVGLIGLLSLPFAGLLRVLSWAFRK
jgi:hypothetical protein